VGAPVEAKANAAGEDGAMDGHCESLGWTPRASALCRGCPLPGEMSSV